MNAANERCVSHSELGLQTFNQQRVVDGVEYSRQVDTNQHGDLLVVRRRVYAVENFQECSLCRVASPIRRLVLTEVDGVDIDRLHVAGMT